MDGLLAELVTLWALPDGLLPALQINMCHVKLKQNVSMWRSRMQREVKGSCSQGPSGGLLASGPRQEPGRRLPPGSLLMRYPGVECHVHSWLIFNLHRVVG